MTLLNQEDVQKIAELAKIEISAEETLNYLRDINNILGHLSEVKNANINDIENSFPFFNQTRDDEVNSNLFDISLIYENMPNKDKDNQVKIKKVIKK